MAFQNKYPAHLGLYPPVMTPLHIVQCPCPEYKLVLRQAQCLIRLAQYKEGLLALHKCQATLNCSKLSDDKKAAVVKDIAALETEAVKLESKPTKTIEQSSTMELNNPEMPGASQKLGLEVSTDRVKGRFVTAKEDIEVINLIICPILLSNLSRWERFYSKSLPTAVCFSPLTTPATVTSAWYR